MNVRQVLIASVIGLLGCGSDTKGPAHVDTTSAKATTTSAANVRTSFSSMNGSSAASGVQALGNSIQGSVQAGAATSALTEALNTMDNKADTAGCTCTATGCTYTNCSPTSGYTLNGSIMVSGDSYTFDLTAKLSASGIDFMYTYKGTMTISATKIDGSFTLNGSADLSSIKETYDYKASWSNVTLDTSGCATGGTYHVEGSYSVSTSVSVPGYSGGVGSYSGSGTVTFGPACGMATASK